MIYIEGLLGLLGSFGIILVIGWVIFGYIDVIDNWKHRRDLNRNVRKDTHIQYSNTVDKLMADIDKNGKITDDETIVTLVALVNSAAGSVKGRRLKQRLFDKRIMVDELKRVVRDGVGDDFKVNKKVTVKKIINKKLAQDLTFDEAELNKLLILICTAAFTEQSDVIRYDDKFTKIVRSIDDLHKFPKKELLKLFKIK